MELLISTQWSVNTLVDHFEKGMIAIPEIQRDVVWSSDQIKDLLDSIDHNFPCGSLIVWEPRLKDEKLMREIIRPERLKFYKNRLPKYFLIDGQQRVTALASVLLRQGFLKSIEPEIEDQLSSLYVDVTRFPAEIVAGADGEVEKFPWVPMNDLFTGALKDRSAYKRSLSAEQRGKIDSYVQNIRNYQFPVQIIQERGYAEVGQIFSRVNSLGTQLTGAEIHLASIVPYWKGISAEFRRYRGDLRKTGFELDLTFLMRTITVIGCDVPQIKRLADKVEHKKISRAGLDQLWTSSKSSINTVIQTLSIGLGLDRTKFVPSKNAMVPLVYYAAKSGKRRLDQKAMMKYFLVAQLGGRFSGAGETVLRKDLKYLSDPNVTPTEGLRELLDVAVREAKQEYRGLRISPNQIKGPWSKTAILLLMYLVMRKRGATDFGLSDAKDLQQIRSNDLQVHHIFPFDFMMNDNKGKLYQRSRGLRPSEYRDQINDIANVTFLSRKKNVQIGNVPPWQYLPNETTAQIRKAHFIPENKELWTVENFDKYLDQRRKLLAEAMNALILGLQ